jgi:hypothetical protein
MIPLELITMGASGLLSGLMTIWSQSMQSKQQAFENAIEGLKVKAGVIDQARRYGNKGFQFTRRTIALAAVGAIVVWPKVVPLFWPGITVTVGWTEWNPGFLFFEGSEATEWKTLTGLVLTPLDTHLMSAIVGLYFGASVVKNAR